MDVSLNFRARVVSSFLNLFKRSELRMPVIVYFSWFCAAALADGLGVRQWDQPFPPKAFVGLKNVFCAALLFFPVSLSALKARNAHQGKWRGIWMYNFNGRPQKQISHLWKQNDVTWLPLAQIQLNSNLFRVLVKSELTSFYCTIFGRLLDIHSLKCLWLLCTSGFSTCLGFSLGHLVLSGFGPKYRHVCLTLWRHRHAVVIGSA